MAPRCKEEKKPASRTSLSTVKLKHQSACEPLCLRLWMERSSQKTKQDNTNCQQKCFVMCNWFQQCVLTRLDVQSNRKKHILMCLFYLDIIIFPFPAKKRNTWKNRQHVAADRSCLLIVAVNFVPATTTSTPCHPAVTSLAQIASVRAFRSGGRHSIQTGAECSRPSAFAFHFTSADSSVATLTLEGTIYNLLEIIVQAPGDAAQLMEVR